MLSQFSHDLGPKSLTMEVGKLAQQANGVLHPPEARLYLLDESDDVPNQPHSYPRRFGLRDVGSMTPGPMVTDAGDGEALTGRRSDNHIYASVRE